MASATGARVDVWKLQRKDLSKEADEDLDFGDDQVSPYATITKFAETVTAIKLREDGQVILTGDRLGKI